LNAVDAPLSLSEALSATYTQFVFERFSEQARRVLFFARVEVSRWGSPQIEPEHLLLGLIREGKGTAALRRISVHATPMARLASDHFPVVAEIDAV
jgi:hypothetical protein